MIQQSTAKFEQLPSALQHHHRTIFFKLTKASHQADADTAHVSALAGKHAGESAKVGMTDLETVSSSETATVACSVHLTSYCSHCNQPSGQHGQISRPVVSSSRASSLCAVAKTTVSRGQAWLGHALCRRWYSGVAHVRRRRSGGYTCHARLLCLSNMQGPTSHTCSTPFTPSPVKRYTAADTVPAAPRWLHYTVPTCRRGKTLQFTTLTCRKTNGCRFRQTHRAFSLPTAHCRLKPDLRIRTVTLRIFKGLLQSAVPQCLASHLHAKAS